MATTRTTAFAIAASLACTFASAQSLSQQIVGTWLATSQYVDQGGKKVEPFGPDPKGMAVYTADGHFILVLQKATLPRFASNNRMTGTDEENKAVVRGSIGYYGRYTLDEKEGKIKLRYEGSTYPNWDGDEQVRLVSVNGDELKLVSPVSTVGGGVVNLVMRRAR